MRPSSPPPRTRRGRRRFLGAVTFHVSEFDYFPPARDWAELPMDALLHVLGKLEPVDLLMGGAPRVCRSWHRAARREPELWRQIDMRSHFVKALNFWRQIEPSRLARAFLRLSAGQCEAFWCDRHLDDDLILFLADQSPSLKILHLDITTWLLEEVIKKLPLLEDLGVSIWANLYDTKLLDTIAKACPRLKHYKHAIGTHQWVIQDICGPYSMYGYDTAATRLSTVPWMPELRSLSLLGDTVESGELAAILDGCPRLDHLSLHDCHRINLDDDALRARLGRIRTTTIDHRFYDDWERESPTDYGQCMCTMCSTFRLEDYWDAYASDGEEDDCYDAASHYLGSGVDDAELEEHERVLDIKCMRRYLWWV